MKYHAGSASKGQDMTLVQLRHLIALADTGSFSRAAERVNLTQPALSRSIQSLEEELGAALFDRIGRRAELTPMGREILDRARLLVLDAQDLQERARATAKGRTGRLRVGMGSGPAALLATPLLLQVAATRPQWRVEVARGATELLAQRLRARTLDALVVDLRSLPVADDLHVELTRELRGAFMVRPGHPLARRRVLHFEDVRAYPLAGIPLSAEVASALVALYGSAAHPDQALSVRGEDIASLVEVAQRSDAVLLSIRAAAPGLLELPLDPPMTVSARLGLVTLARRTPPASLEVLRELAARLMVEPAFPHSR
jgi:DNA-binding transcriptional LysR family regulator